MNNILYSFRRCPFAIRARWALIKSKITFECREVNLNKKPIELLTNSPKGTVPVLVTYNGEVIDESLDIMCWSIKESNDKNYLNNTQTLNAEISHLINENDITFKYHLDRYKYSKRYENIDTNYHKEQARNILRKWNSQLSGENSKDQKWLINKKESLADWSIWPFVRQYKYVDKEFFDLTGEIKELSQWLDFYTSNIIYSKLMTKLSPWHLLQDPVVFINK